MRLQTNKSWLADDKHQDIPSPFSVADPVEQGILEQLGTISSALREPSTRDGSDNIGQIVACQHRTLNPEQGSIYL